MSTAPGIREPVPQPLQRVLRAAVLEHAAAPRQRPARPVLHVGVPGRRPRTFEVRAEDRLDHALRVEAVEALCRESLARDFVPLLWLTREEDGHDLEDLAWAAAVGAAGRELGVRLDLVVVTCHWWRDPRTGVGRSWRRVPRRRPAA